MGQGTSKTSSAPAARFVTTDAFKTTDAIKTRISQIDSKRTFKPIVTEHIPSVKPKDIKKTIEKAKEDSVAAFAPIPTCIDYCIFEDNASEVWGGNSVIVDFANSQFSGNKELDKCLGSIYGMAIGDSWGHTLEFVPVQYEKVIIKKLDKLHFSAPGVYNKFGLKAGQYTDDTSMGLCLADSLLVSGHVDQTDLRKRFVMWWFLGYNNAFRFDEQCRNSQLWFGRSVGLGGQISHSLQTFIQDHTSLWAEGSEDMSGNGSIMRLCPLPIFYRNEDVEFLVSEAMKQSFTTHSGLHSAECSAVLSYVIVCALKSECTNGKDFLDSLDWGVLDDYIQSDTVKALVKGEANKVS